MLTSICFFFVWVRWISDFIEGHNFQNRFSVNNLTFASKIQGMLEVLAFIGAILIGVILGLMGGGGSIVTVPILVYLLGYSPVVATGYSLFVVGSTSLVGSTMYFKRGLVNIRAALIFGIPAAIAVFLTRQFVVPAIPEKLFSIGEFVVTNNVFLMVIFALMMLFASVSMIRKKKDQAEKKDSERTKMKPYQLVVQGFGVGLLTGLVGVGGGFLIVPALVLFSRLDMKTAVGTSLLIMSVNSLFGFIGDILNREIDWSFLLIFTGLSIMGIFAGNALSKMISGPKLKTGFGWLILLMGIYIFIKELFL